MFERSLCDYGNDTDGDVDQSCQKPTGCMSQISAELLTLTDSVGLVCSSYSGLGIWFMLIFYFKRVEIDTTSAWISP